jgi:ribosomal protein S18 acetylase RimI-like enzyme
MADVRAGAADDIDSVTTALARAFHDDPVMHYLFPAADGRERKLRSFFASEAKRSLTKGKLETAGPSTSQGAAIWFGPGHWKLGGFEMLTQIPMIARFGKQTPRALRLLGQIEKVHPKEPHWYLAVLGTDTAHQGKGIGSALLAPILARCDEEGLPAYLESSKKSNIPFYNRHGFEVSGEVTAKDGPTLWPMYREPRPPES